MKQADSTFMKQVSSLYYEMKEIQNEVENCHNEIEKLKKEVKQTGLVIANENDHNAVAARTEETNGRIEFLSEKQQELLSEYYKVKNDLVTMDLIRYQWYVIEKGFLRIGYDDQIKYYSFESLLKALEDTEENN